MLLVPEVHPHGGTGIFLIPDALMSLKKLRRAAYLAQQGRCYYCQARMWLACPSELGLRPQSSRSFQCTAEHLLAKQDGGQDTPENIVAACSLCNLRRHQRRSEAPSPAAYRALVRKRVSMGKWWPSNLIREVGDGP